MEQDPAAGRCHDFVGVNSINPLFKTMLISKIIKHHITF